MKFSDKANIAKTFLLGGIILTSLYNCSSDSETVAPTPQSPLQTTYQVDRMKVLNITNDAVSDPNAKYTWSTKDSILSNEKNLDFISISAKSYPVTLKVESNGKTFTYNTTVNVQQEKTPYSKHISEVLDFLPAPGQFVNDLPKYVSGDTKDIIVKKANDAVAKGANGMIHLGGFGGYVTFKFDHTIVNGPGKDFKVLGNAFAGNSEPGIIMVAFDKNKNGKPDDDEWYEIAGSEYFKDSTIKNYSITYYKPDESKAPVKGTANWQTDTEYIRWEDNQGNKGYLTKNSYHKQSYYPMWIGESSITFKGTRIADNFKQGTNGIWSSPALEFGYADNVPNDNEASNIDISWAVDKSGKYVKLPGIDFIKVYGAVRQESGILGEVSTEVTGAYDLRIK